jgi:hypothetical protein
MGKTERLLARTTRTTRVRPSPPRDGQFDATTNLLTWTAPERGAKRVTHYRVRIGSDTAAPLYEVPVGQTSLQLTGDISRVFISAYSQINDLESTLLLVDIAPGVEVTVPGDVTLGVPLVRFDKGDALVAIPYTPPDPLGDFDHVRVWLYAPDTVVDNPATIGDGGFIVPVDASDAGSGGKIPATGGPADKGTFAYDPDNLLIQFKHPAPTAAEKWRVAVASGTAKLAEKSTAPTTVFDVTPPASGSGDGQLGTAGAEYGPNIRNASGQWYEDDDTLDASMFPTWWFTLKWDLPTEDPRWEKVVGWQLWVYDPAKAQDPGRLVNHGFAHVTDLPKNTSTFVLTGRWNLSWTPDKVTIYLVPQDADGNINTFVKGVNDAATFNVFTARGLKLQYVDGTSIDGIDFEVDPDTHQFRIKNLDLQKAFGYSSEFTIHDGQFQFAGGLDFSKFDPAKLSGPFDLSAGTIAFKFDPADFDASTGQFTIKSLKAGLFGAEFGVTGGKIILSSVDFSKAAPGTFSTEFTNTGGVFGLGTFSADKIKTGVLEVGGGTRASRLKVFDTATPQNLIGWVGDDSAGSGYVGAWFKRILIGGTDPSTAKLVADAAGNVSLPAGCLSAGTLVAGVIYAGAISATQINTGSLNVGGPGQAGNVLVSDSSSALIGWIGSYGGYAGAWFKRIMIGGTDPSTAKLVADAYGNLTIPAGCISTGVLMSGIIFAGTISANNVTAGVLTGSALSLTQNNIITSVNNALDSGFGGYAGITVKSTLNWQRTLLSSDAFYSFNSNGYKVISLGCGGSLVSALYMYDEVGNASFSLSNHSTSGGMWFYGNRDVYFGGVGTTMAINIRGLRGASGSFLDYYGRAVTVTGGIITYLP